MSSNTYSLFLADLTNNAYGSVMQWHSHILLILVNLTYTQYTWPGVIFPSISPHSFKTVGHETMSSLSLNSRPLTCTCKNMKN